MSKSLKGTQTTGTVKTSHDETVKMSWDINLTQTKNRVQIRL